MKPNKIVNKPNMTLVPEFTETFDTERFLAGEPCISAEGDIRHCAKLTRAGVEYRLNEYDVVCVSKASIKQSAEHRQWKMKPKA